jgi:hypothetical protein
VNVARVLATIGLGLLSGALLTEAAVLVPYWRSIAAQMFTDLHEGVAPRLYRFFAPLTVGATVLAGASGVLAAASSPSEVGDWLTVASALLAISLLGFYRFYFASANERLPRLARGGDPSALSGELRRWQQVHCVRTGVCLAAFVCAVAAL